MARKHSPRIRVGYSVGPPPVFAGFEIPAVKSAFARNVERAIIGSMNTIFCAAYPRMIDAVKVLPTMSAEGHAW